MKGFKNELLAILSELKGSGKFASVGTQDFIIPGLIIDEIGEVSFPLNEIQAMEIIRVAHKAPFGMGRSTILDETIRKTWEIDADKFTFTNPSWTKLLDRIIKKIKVDLGLEKYQIVANIYKLLLYEEGGFFLEHKDSEKEKGMFGSLIIGLPSKHRGGELIVEFGNMKEVVSFENDFCINYAAFYADCDHEIKPLISGYRICLVYNLIQQKSVTSINPPSIYQHAENLAQLLLKAESKNKLKPYIILLSHQYTPENFSKENLKLDDRIKVETLMLAAEKLGFYSKMCLVTSYVEGSPKEDSYDYSYRSRYDDDDDDEVDENTDVEIDEIYEEQLSIEHWVENNFPNIENIEFVEEDLITSFKLNDDQPIIKKSTGYMGNYGPDIMYWYHYGAVMLWSHTTNAELFLNESSTNQLAWIDCFSRMNEMHTEELKALQSAIKFGIKANNPKSNNYNSITKWIIKHNQKELLLNMDDEVICFYFCQIATENWIELVAYLSNEESIELISKITSNVSFEVVEKLPSLLSEMLGKDLLKELVIEQSEKLPQLFNLIYQDNQKRVKSFTISSLFEIEKKLHLGVDWVSELSSSLTDNPSRDYIHKILVPVVINEKENFQLKKELAIFCKYYLQNLIDNKPNEPSNWTRELPESAQNNLDWNKLKAFLASPTEEVFDFRKNQNERTALESLIRYTDVDLAYETIRIGSPHTLRIKKTQTSYLKLLKMWKEDVALQNRIDN